MGWFTSGSDIGEGVQKASEGIRTLFTGDLPPDAKVKVLEIQASMDEVVQKMQESDNAVGGINRLIRPLTFLTVLIVWLSMVISRGYGLYEVDEMALKNVSSLLDIVIPSFFIYRTVEKVKGLTK